MPGSRSNAAGVYLKSSGFDLVFCMFVFVCVLYPVFCRRPAIMSILPPYHDSRIVLRSSVRKNCDGWHHSKQQRQTPVGVFHRAFPCITQLSMATFMWTSLGNTALFTVFTATRTRFRRTLAIQSAVFFKYLGNVIWIIVVLFFSAERSTEFIPVRTYLLHHVFVTMVPRYGASTSVACWPWNFTQKNS